MLSLRHVLPVLNLVLGRPFPSQVRSNFFRSTHKQHIALTSSLESLVCPAVTVSTSYITVTANVTSTVYVSPSPPYNSSSSTQIASQGFPSSGANFTSAAANSTTSAQGSVLSSAVPFPITVANIEQKSSPPHQTSRHSGDFFLPNDKRPNISISSFNG